MKTLSDSQINMVHIQSKTFETALYKIKKRGCYSEMTVVER